MHRLLGISSVQGRTCKSGDPDPGVGRDEIWLRGSDRQLILRAWEDILKDKIEKLVMKAERTS